MTNVAYQSRYGSSFKVYYPDFPSFRISPENVKITQEFGMQDVVEITYTRFSTFHMKALKTGTPVQINFSNDKLKSVWVGYVYDVYKNNAPSLKRPLVVRCTNTGLSLKEGGSKIWTNKSATDVVIEIAQKFKLKSNVIPHKTIYTQISLSGQTYWEKLQELAAKIGYVAHIFGTELFFLPMDKMIDKFMTSVPFLKYIEDDAEPYTKIKDQTLDVFRAKLGDYTDTQQNTKRKKIVNGIDPITAKFYSVTSSPSTVGKNIRKNVSEPLFTQIASTAVSGNKQTAQVAADAQAQLSRFVHTATGMAQGDPRIAPYGTVQIDGTGQDTDGYWVIKKVIHFLTHDGRYTSEFTCMSDGRGLNKPSATRSPYSGYIPQRNIISELSSSKPSKPNKSYISSSTIIVNANNTGFKVGFRRWVGD